MIIFQGKLMIWERKPKVRLSLEYGENPKLDYSSVARIHKVFMNIILHDNVRSSYLQLVSLSEDRYVEDATCSCDKEHS